MKQRVLVLIVCSVLQLLLVEGVLYAQEEMNIDLSFYASTQGEMRLNFVPQWKFPFIRGKNPLTEGNNITIKLDASLSTMFMGLTGNVVMDAASFLSFNIGASIGTGWNYDLFGKKPLTGLGLNRKTCADDPNDGVIGKGFDGLLWDAHLGTMIYFDFALIFPGDWNHIVIRLYNDLQYFAYTNANGGDLWYYLNDDGMNQNTIRHNCAYLIGYEMPIFLDFVGFQLSGTLPFYNTETGIRAGDIGYSSSNSLLLNFKINNNFSIKTIASITHFLKYPITSSYEREWKFDRVQLIAAWRIL